MQRHPTTTLAQLLLAAVFIVMGGYRLYRAWHGVPTAGSTLTFSVIELALGVLIAANWRLRATAMLAALLMLLDAVMAHRFWSLNGAAQSAQLLHFMKNLGLAGGFLLLAGTAGSGRRGR